MNRSDVAAFLRGMALTALLLGGTFGATCFVILVGKGFLLSGFPGWVALIASLVAILLILGGLMQVLDERERGS